jgi:hypothetical protein
MWTDPKKIFSGDDLINLFAKQRLASDNPMSSAFVTTTLNFTTLRDFDGSSAYGMPV